MKELRRLLLITAATAGLALSLTGCSKNVDFLQYADVTFDGINGQATATVNVDFFSFYANRTTSQFKSQPPQACDFSHELGGFSLDL